MREFRFKKEERLSGRKQMEKLFREGRSFYLSPFRILVLEEKKEGVDRPVVRMAVSVPRRLFKRAVKRNLLKRRIREAYRLNKAVLTDYLAEKGIFLDMIFIYIAREVLPYRDIEDKIVLSLQKIRDEYEKAAL